MGGDRGKGWKATPTPSVRDAALSQLRAALQVQREQQQQHNEGPAGTKDEQAQALEQRGTPAGDARKRHEQSNLSYLRPRGQTSTGN